MKLADLPEYVGQDKPQRGANPRVDKFIVAAPRPFEVVFKKNPKHDDTEQGKMKPARLFVRWGVTAPAAEPSTDPSPEEMDALDLLMKEWERVGRKRVNVDALLKWLGAANLSSLTRAQYNTAKADLEKKIAGGAA